MSEIAKEILNQFFKQTELAGELEVTTRTLARWDEEGVGPPITRIGNQILYRKESVWSWLRSREQRRRPVRARARQNRELGPIAEVVVSR